MILVDRHHRVLPGWAAFRATLKRAPRLITLDHHTDTSVPFRNHIRAIYGNDHAGAEKLRQSWLSTIDFRNLETVNEALTRLNNDEHVIAAIKTDIVSSAFVIAHNAYDTDLETYREHQIMCRGVDRKPQSKKIERADCDRVLDSDFLNEIISSFDEALALAGEPALLAEPYIFDIDLDYLNTRLSAQPRDATTIRKLARGAGLISVATEPDYVTHCALDADLTSESLLLSLKDLLSL